MKKKILYLLIMVLCFVPSFVKAADSKVKVYFFTGSGSSDCENVVTFFNELSDSEKQKFDLIQYEVWFNEENKELMKEVSKKLGEETTGVPYIVVGDKAFSGFKEETRKEIINLINTMYDNKDFTDVIHGSNNTILFVVIIVLIFSIIGIGIILSMKKKKNEKQK